MLIDRVKEKIYSLNKDKDDELINTFANLFIAFDEQISKRNIWINNRVKQQEKLTEVKDNMYKAITAIEGETDLNVREVALNKCITEMRSVLNEMS